MPAMCGMAGIVSSRASAEIGRSMAQRAAASRSGEGVWVRNGKGDSGGD
ncbi:MAG TPA: hypothetical protein VGN30_12205 [Steroidobacteraceae bacterium]